MDYIGIIITGTSGAGKSTVARQLCKDHEEVGRVTAVTTRKVRTDDVSGEYRHVSNDEFDQLKHRRSLLVEDTYRGEFYGITNHDFQQVVDSSKIPLLVITPKSATDLLGSRDEDVDETESGFMSFFLDTDDKTLDARLRERGDSTLSSRVEARARDREIGEKCLYRLHNFSSKGTSQTVWNLWVYRGTGGVLSERLIRLMMECGMLLNYAELENVTGAAYDLSIGDEYYYGGKIRELTSKDPFILIEPYDYAIVTCRELANLPRDIAARFDLSVSLFCQGLILSNGPQVDPGFQGRLFCLLFNTSNAPVFLKRRQHYATIEFHKLVEPTRPYRGKYQGKEEIVHYLPSNTLRGGINELKKELEQVRRESRILQEIFLAVISLILAIIAILLVIGQ